jgi:hypothetical protein
VGPLVDCLYQVSDERSKMSREDMETWEVSVPPPRLTKIPPPLEPRSGT